MASPTHHIVLIFCLFFFFPTGSREKPTQQADIDGFPRPWNEDASGNLVFLPFSSFPRSVSKPCSEPQWETVRSQLRRHEHWPLLLRNYTHKLFFFELQCSKLQLRGSGGYFAINISSSPSHSAWSAVKRQAISYKGALGSNASLKTCHTLPLNFQLPFFLKSLALFSAEKKGKMCKQALIAWRLKGEL